MLQRTLENISDGICLVPCYFTKKSPSQVFFFEYCQKFQNIFFKGHLQATTLSYLVTRAFKVYKYDGIANFQIFKFFNFQKKLKFSELFCCLNEIQIKKKVGGSSPGNKCAELSVYFKRFFFHQKKDLVKEILITLFWLFESHF